VARYFGLENFSLTPRSFDLPDLLMAADAVLLTAETDPWSVPAALSVALQRPLICTDVEGRDELRQAAGSDLVRTVPPGDLAGFAAAVEAAVVDRPRPRATKKAWKAAVTRSRRGLQTISDVLRPAAAESGDEP
jgi:hypothetical protein